MYKRERFQLFIHENLTREDNMHSELEILFVIEGKVRLSVEQMNYELETEDVFVINANKRHAFAESEGLLLMRLMIDSKLLSEAFGGQEQLIFCDPSLKANKKYREVQNLMKVMLRHSVETENFENSFGFGADCYAIMNLLTANFMVRVSDYQSEDDDSRYEDRLARINHYINSNYDQEISMKDLSEKLYLSNGYLSRFFKKNYGMSFANYLTKVRLFHAADQLVYSDDSITLIAHNCGFASAAFFNKVFRSNYGVSPTEFRKKSAGRKTEERPADSAKLKKRINEWVINDETRDLQPVEPKHLLSVEREISVRDVKAFEKSWGDTINFGAASNLLHSSIREQLVYLQEKVGFKYLRFWGLFTQEFYIRPEETEYDFSQIDIVLDFVLEQGLYPFIELASKPDIIFRSVGDAEEWGYGRNQFTAEQWKRLIRAFMRHLSVRYGKEKLEGWRMELWFDEKYRTDESKWQEYFERFHDTAEEIKKYNKLIEFGGYGVRMDYSSKTKRHFLEKWLESGCRPDFISIMFYGYEKGNDSDLDIYAKRTTDDDSFLHLTEKEIALIREAGFSETPIYVCEWNLTPCVRNIMNDTDFKGAYIIKTILDLYGMVQSMGYGAGSDRQYAAYDTSGLLFGGNGLISKDGILKPAAYALEFLNRMYPYYIGKDRNFMVTTDHYDNYAIVCHNQQPLNYNYYLTEESALDRTATWKYFEGRYRLKLTLQLKDLADGQYRIKTYRVNYLNGSLLDTWAKMEFENELSRNDLTYLRRICEPHLSIRNVESKKGKILLEEELLINEIALIWIRKVDL